jgi:hypothetical protein
MGPIHAMPHKFVGNTVEQNSMKLIGARANATSPALGLRNAARDISRNRLNLLIELRHSLHVVQFFHLANPPDDVVNDNLARLRRFDFLDGSFARCANDWAQRFPLFVRSARRTRQATHVRDSSHIRGDEQRAHRRSDGQMADWRTSDRELTPTFQSSRRENGFVQFDNICRPRDRARAAITGDIGIRARRARRQCPRSAPVKRRSCARVPAPDRPPNRSPGSHPRSTATRARRRVALRARLPSIPEMRRATAPPRFPTPRHPP